MTRMFIKKCARCHNTIIIYKNDLDEIINIEGARLSKVWSPKHARVVGWRFDTANSKRTVRCTYPLSLDIPLLICRHRSQIRTFKEVKV